jgi:hypothetical protein
LMDARHPQLQAGRQVRIRLMVKKAFGNLWSRRNRAQRGR